MATQPSHMVMIHNFNKPNIPSTISHKDKMWKKKYALLLYMCTRIYELILDLALNCFRKQLTKLLAVTITYSN